jgi:hypothetical protein
VTREARSDLDAGDDFIERHATTGPILPNAAAHFSSCASRDQLSVSRVLKGYHHKRPNISTVSPCFRQTGLAG